MVTETASVDRRVAEVADVGSLGLWRLSVEQYHAMGHAGILEDGAPIELLEGLLVAKVTKNPPHELVKQLLPTAIERMLPSGWFVRREAPLTLADSEPEPDLAVVRGDPRAYAARHPAPAETALVVEIADASLHRDLTLKKRIYARAGIPCYWVIDLRERRVEVLSKPVERDGVPDYDTRVVVGDDGMLPVVVEGRQVGQLVMRDVLP